MGIQPYSADLFNVIVKGRPINKYYKDDQIFVEGRKGSNYTIKYQNLTAVRKKIVITVDGINIITGKEDFSQGYVVSPYGTVEIPGWRKDNKNVANFVFSSVPRSYNQRTDRHDVDNVGVIGCIVFDEVYVPQNWQPLTWIANDINTFGSYNLCGSFLGGAPVESQSVGTGYGDNQKFQTIDVDYKFNSFETNKHVIYYDDVDGLRRRGVEIHRERSNNRPDPFPGYISGVPKPVR